MERTIQIGGKAVKMRATARLPHEYRDKFGKDLIVQMQKIDYDDPDDYEVFERLGWLMALCAGDIELHPGLSANEEVALWLDSFDGIFDFMNALPDIIGLWTDSKGTMSKPGKK